MAKYGKSRNHGGTKPPQYKSQPVLRRTLRFVASAVQSSVVITPKSLCASLGSVCASNTTTMYILAGSVRVRRIQMWVGTATSGTQANVLVNFYTTGVAATNYEVGDDTINSSTLAYISVKPPSGTQAQFWNPVSSTTTLFSLTSSANCVMDLDLEYIMSDNDTGNPTYASTQVGTIGNVYYINLNGVNSFAPYLLSSLY